MSDVIVVGAGVAGLGAALALGRAGHHVTVLERDATPLPASADEAFEWDRRGAPQVRHSHAFLARLHNLLRDRYPDVLAALLAAGATEITLHDMLPEGMDPTPEPGDEDLVLLACRRTTFEWVLRRCVLAEPHVELDDGVVVEGLTAGGGRVTGVRLADGTTRAADVVVAADGRRSSLPAWLEQVGLGPVPEEEDDTGIVYWSRFYRLRDGTEAPKREGPTAADLGHLKFAVFLGDNGTFSVTLATNAGDGAFRGLRRAEGFDAVVATLVPIRPWVDPAVSEPITDVHPMAGLLNRRRRFVVDGRPVAPGLHAVGDTSVCTNPLYGRGCSLAMVHATLLADALAAHPGDPVAQAVAFDEATGEQLVPWYRAAVAQDQRARAVAAGEEDPMASLVREGLLPAIRIDPAVFRAFVRTFNLLDTPDAVLSNPDLLARVSAVYETRDERPPEPPLGPGRDELLALLGN